MAGKLEWGLLLWSAKKIVCMTMRPSSSSSCCSASPSLTLSSLSVAVDKATSELLLTPDWTIIIAICDSLNSNRWYKLNDTMVLNINY